MIQFAKRHAFLLFIAGSLTAVCVSVTLIVFKWPHLEFYFDTSRPAYAHVPVTSLRQQAIPDNWLRCEFGGLSFRVPPGMTAATAEANSSIGLMVLADDEREVWVFLPIRDEAGFERERQYLRENEVVEPSVLSARIAALRTDPREFSWSMSARELKRLECLLALTGGRWLARAETLDRGDLHGLISYWEVGGAEMAWHCEERGVRSSMIFKVVQGATDDQWIQTVLSSLEWSGKFFEVPIDVTSIEATVGGVAVPVK